MNQQRLTSSGDPLVCSKSIRARLNLGPAGFAAALRDGLPHYRLNRRVLRFRISEVETWLADRRRGDTK